MAVGSGTQCIQAHIHMNERSSSNVDLSRLLKVMTTGDKISERTRELKVMGSNGTFYTRWCTCVWGREGMLLSNLPSCGLPVLSCETSLAG
jgi:hypothetical protein